MHDGDVFSIVHAAQHEDSDLYDVKAKVSFISNSLWPQFLDCFFDFFFGAINNG
jgi:hypothetical protein